MVAAQAAAMSPQPLEPVSVRVDAARHALASRLMDSLMHDVRNPLNAISIHLEVLSQKLRQELDEAGSYEKNLKAIRDQVTRVDALLRQFAEFMGPRRPSSPTADFSALVTRALDAVGHETRRGRVTLKTSVEPDLHAAAADGSALPFLALQPLMRAVARSAPGQAVEVKLTRAGARLSLLVKDAGAPDQEPFPDAPAALSALAAALGGMAQVGAGECLVSLPLS